MNVYRVLRAIHKPLDQVYYRLTFEVVRLIKAPSAEDAIALAKRAGISAPIVEPAKEQLQ